MKARKENVKKKTSAALLLIAANCGIYSEMENYLQQNIAMGMNNYPSSTSETMNVLDAFVKTSKEENAKIFNYRTQSREKNFKHTWDLSKVTYYNCDEKGHYAKICLKSETNKSSGSCPGCRRYP